MGLRRLARAAHLLVAARGLALTAGDARYRAALDAVVARRTSGFLVVVEDGTDVANAASIARTADCFGIPEILLVSEVSDAHYDAEGEELRILSASATSFVRMARATGTAATLERLRGDGYVNVAAVMPRPGEICATLPSADDAATVAALGGDLSRVALWLGTESRGLTRTAADGADARVHIPHAGAVASLNVASAAAILVAELSRLRALDPPPALAPDAAAALTAALLRQRESTHVPQRRSRRRYAAAARGEIFKRRREQGTPS